MAELLSADAGSVEAVVASDSVLGDAWRVFEAMPHGVVLHGADGAITAANPAAARILGLSLSQLMGRTSMDPRWRAIHEDSSAFPGDTHPAMIALNTGRTVDAVTMGVARQDSGDTRWLDVSARPLFRPGEPAPYQVVVTFVDITEQKRAERSLRDSRALLIRAERAASLGHYEIDMRAGLLRASDGAKQIYGVVGDTLSLRDIQSCSLPEYRPMLDAALAGLVARGEPYDVEFRIRRPNDGAVRHIHSVGEYDAAREVMFGVITDDTEAKEAAEELRRQTAFARSVFDADHAHVAVVGPDGVILDVNAAWRRFAHANGAPNEDALGVGANYFAACRPAAEQDGSLSAVDGIRAVQDGRLDSFSMVYPCHSPGEERWFTLRVLPLAGRPGTVLVQHRNETSRLTAETALREGEFRYRSLFDTIREGFALHEIITDDAGAAVDYRFIDVNPAFEKMTGMQRAHCVGRTARQLLPGLEAHWIERYGRVAIEGQTAEFENFTEALDRWYHVLAFQPAPRRFATLITDVTDRRMAERTVRESESRYRMLAENSGDVIWLLDLTTGRFEYVSPSVERLRGYTPEEVMAQPLDAAMTPESVERVQRWIAARVKGFREDDPSTFTFTDEVDQLCKDGRVVPTEVVTRYLPGGNGAIAKVLGVSRDIRERRKAEAALRASEARFQMAFRSSPAIMTLSELSTGRYLDVNDRFCQASGYLRSECLGRTGVELGWIGPEERARVIASIRGGGSALNRETTVRTRTGELRHCLVSAEVLELNGVACLMIIATDITEAKRIENERALLESQLQHLKRMESIGRLAGGVAHDMNNVMTAILTLAELQLADAPINSSLAEDMETIAQACLRGQSTVRALLDFARADVSKDEPLDLNALIREEVALLGRTTLKKAHLATDLDDALPAVRGDRAALSHVFMNLCLNAVDAMPQGGTITLKTRRDGKTHVLVDVADTGLGMPPEVLEKALDPFFTTKPQGQGTGLGLSIVFGTIKAHGGTMQVQSTPGVGTTISIRLPVSGPSAAFE